MHALAGDLFGDFGGGDVFGNVVRFEAGDDDLRNSRRFQPPPRRRRSACPS
jgi:hypothetical protein